MSTFMTMAPNPSLETPREQAGKPGEKAAALERVQRRVATSVFLSVAVHGVVALPIVAGIMHANGEEGNAIGMVVMTGIVGLLTVVAARFILGHKPFAPLWLALGILPLAAAIWYVWYAPFSIH